MSLQLLAGVTDASVPHAAEEAADGVEWEDAAEEWEDV
jgi:hypothetical protein